MNETDALLTRVQARRLACVCEMLGEPVPPDAVRILAADTEDMIAQDSQAFERWCQERGVEWFEISNRGVRLPSNPGKIVKLAITLE